MEQLNLINQIVEVFHSYFHYLIHPYKTHDSFQYPEREVSYRPIRLSPYESLSTSWFFIILNGLMRVITLNFVILFFLELLNDSSLEFSRYFNLDEFPGLLIIVLSAIVDIIFYPLFGIFIIQFWEFIIKFYGNLLKVEGDLTRKAQDIISVYLSSNVLKIIPIFGAPFHSFAGMILMYAGLRSQLNASAALSICIIFTPALIILSMVSVMFLFLIFLV